MYTTFTIVGEAASYLKTTYILIVILVTFLNGNATAILKKKTASTSFDSPQDICKFSFLLFEVLKNVQFYAFKRAYTRFSNESFCFVLL